MTDILEQLKSRIHSKISELNFTTWFKPIKNAVIKDNTFCLIVPNKFVSDWIIDYYADMIHHELYAMTQIEYRLTFEVDEQSEQEEKKTIHSPIIQIPDTPTVINQSIEQLNSKFSFDRFVVGSSNQFAHAACKAVADLPGGHYNPLFIYGGVGLGKTHLLHAIGLQAGHNRPQSRLIYMSAERFMNELINSLRYEKMHEFRAKFRENCDILLIDDVQFIGGKERTQEEFFHTFNALHESQKQIVVTSDKLPREIPGLEERLRSRFEWGLIADIQAPDLETRIAILKKKADAANIHCGEDVFMFLASSIVTNVRELEGSLIRINAFASLTGTTINIDLARDVLGSIIDQAKKICTIESIQKTVAHYYNVTVADLKSPKRTKGLAHPRQIAMYLSKKIVKSSFPDIGNKFGGKDHTTVIYACRKIEKEMNDNITLKNDIAILEKQLLQ